MKLYTDGEDEVFAVTANVCSDTDVVLRWLNVHNEDNNDITTATTTTAAAATTTTTTTTATTTTIPRTYHSHITTYFW